MKVELVTPYGTIFRQTWSYECWELSLPLTRSAAARVMTQRTIGCHGYKLALLCSAFIY
jgi:hypothetical protein